MSGKPLRAKRSVKLNFCCRVFSKQTCVAQLRPITIAVIFEIHKPDFFVFCRSCIRHLISSRPVFTSGRSIFRGMAEWLVVLLEPLLQGYSTIAIDSDQVQTALLNWSTQWRHSADFHSVPDLQFITLDVEALYPSIDLNHLKEVVSRQILAFYDRKKAEQVIRILDLVLKINDVVFEGRIFRIQKGLPTGSPVSVVLANLYLVEMDAKLMFMPLCLYKRFIDDFCLLVWSDCAQECIRRLHSFHPDIRVKISAQGQKTSPIWICYSQWIPRAGLATNSLPSLKVCFTTFLIRHVIQSLCSVALFGESTSGILEDVLHKQPRLYM